MSTLLLSCSLLAAFPLQGDPAPRPYRDLFGVAVDRAGDLDGDGVEDLWVGDPTLLDRQDRTHGCVWAVSGKTGRAIRRITAPDGAREFGWTLAGLDDVDADGVRDVAVGCLGWTGEGASVRSRGLGPLGASAAFVFSGASGRHVCTLFGPAEALKEPWYSSSAGPALASVGDWDGDGAGDLAVGWAFADRDAMGRDAADTGEVRIVSGRDVRVLRSWHGFEAFDQLGTSLVTLPDLDGDGRAELAAGAVPGAEAEHSVDPARISTGYVLVLSSRGTIRHVVRPPGDSANFGLALAAYPATGAAGTPGLLIGQPHGAATPEVTLWSLVDGKLVARLQPPQVDAWSDAHLSDAARRRDAEISFGTRMLAVPDRDGDGRADVLVTLPKSYCVVPAGVLSSGTGELLGRVQVDWGERELSHVGIGACSLGDLDGDGTQDLAISGASVRCGDCRGAVVLVSGRTSQAIRYVPRRDMSP